MAGIIGMYWGEIISPTYFYIIDASTFVLSTIIILTIKFPSSEHIIFNAKDTKNAKLQDSFFSRVRVTFQEIINSEFLNKIIKYYIFTTIIFSSIAVIQVILPTLSPVETKKLTYAFGVTSGIGSAIAAYILTKKTLALRSSSLFAITALFFLFLGVFHKIYVSIIVFGVISFLLSIIIIQLENDIIITLKHGTVGKGLSFFQIISMASIIIGNYFWGELLHIFSFYSVILIISFLFSLFSFLLSFFSLYLKLKDRIAYREKSALPHFS